MMQDWFANFLSAHRPFPQDRLFTWLWNTDCSHDILNGIKMADEPTNQLLRKMKKDGDLEKGVLIFLSDHGFRQGKFPQTLAGMRENNLPYLFVAFPTWFEKRFPDLVANVRRNSQRLVSSFDIHKTLRHLLHLQTNVATEWTNDGSYAAGDDADDGTKRVESFSLMTEVPKDRTCEKAGIPDAYCGCIQMEELNVTATKNSNDKVQESAGKMASDGAAALIDRINGALEKHFDICLRWILKKILKVSKKINENKYMSLVEASAVNNHNNISAVFNGWVAEKNHKFTIKLDEVSRVDHYGQTSQCIIKRVRNLKEFCSCKYSGARL